MFLVPHLLIFIFTTQINSLDSRYTDSIKDVFLKKTQGITLPTKDVEKNVTTSTHKSFFLIIQNLTSTKGSNLKSNVFDKMLSDEMLSIKKHLYDKDIKTISIAKTSINNAPTPTLEVKQNWPMIGFKLKPHHAESDHSTVHNDDNTKSELQKIDEESNNCNKNDDLNSIHKNADRKVLELRSLPEATVPSPHHCSSLNQGNKICSCMRTNAFTTCSHRCSGTSSKMCSHTSSQCSRTMQVWPYSPVYFLGITTQFPYAITYYHPNVINELKLPRKTKRRKATKVYFDKHLYYDSDDDDESKERKEEFYEDDIDNFYDERKPETSSDRKDSLKLPLHLEDKERSKYKPDNIIMRKEQDKLVKDIFNDLKNYYGDSMVKDCYCRSCSSSLFNHVSYANIYFRSLIIIILTH